ncbi:hypothetical protein PVAP13_6NG204603 [Panicum virgatum]|uniref:Uncharacterized protein n=1 Tax=Panicum virgatum TaxID=38727 RepID=A0A8T0QYD4_PANVG|nr:hypothetical protein PVAP13_6NG204603 [Panicum virgatum]
MDVKIMLTAKGYINTIEEPNPQAPVTDEAKYTILYFLRHHLHRDLKNEYSDLIYDLLQVEKHDELLTKNYQMSPVGATPLPEVHYNSQNSQKKFGGKKFKKNFKGKWNKKRKKFRLDNSQVCQRCGCRNHITKKCHTAKHLVELYQKSVGKQVQGDKYETHFTTQPTDASCSKDTPLENIDEKTPLQMDDLLSTDDMLVEFQSNDIFGDNN